MCTFVKSVIYFLSRVISQWWLFEKWCFIWYQQSASSDISFFVLNWKSTQNICKCFCFMFFFFSHLNVKKCIPSNYLKYSRFLRFSIFLKLWFVINANSIYKIWLGVIQIYFMLQIKHVEYYKYVWTILLIQYIMLK